MIIDLMVSPQDTCVQGHFPGAPLVPGAYLLSYIDIVLSEHYPGYNLVGFSKVKFLAPLLPGQCVCLHVEAFSSEKAQVKITRQDQVLLVASAILRKIQ